MWYRWEFVGIRTSHNDEEVRLLCQRECMRTSVEPPTVDEHIGIELPQSGREGVGQDPECTRGPLLR